MDQSKPIIFFDGVCNLCNSSVQFVIRHDKENRFRFASLQSEAGKELLDRFRIPQNDFNSFILLEDDKIYSRSDAALKVWSKLEGWKWTRIFFAVPAFIRNGVYNIVARNRYRWFGKREECMVPSEELKSRFLD